MLWGLWSIFEKRRGVEVSVLCLYCLLWKDVSKKWMGIESCCAMQSRKEEETEGNRMGWLIAEWKVIDV